ncbi:MAG: hypothetical protein GXO24_03240 [Chlorobi bacterium]|nr:hypothetical protein [Chlorobiota bacterium]
MSRKKEIQNLLKAEIVLQAGRLVKQANDKSFEELVAAFHDLYRKISAWEYLDAMDETGIWPEKKNTKPATPPQTDENSFSQQEKESDTTLHVPENKENPLVLENAGEPDSGDRPAGKPSAPARENPIAKHKEILEKSTRAVFKPKQNDAENPVPAQTPSSSGRRLPEMRIGLADKIALLNNLFDKNTEAFDDFVRRINLAPSYDEALAVVNDIKRRFDWTGKDEYEFRLLQLVQARYA